jgi:hypothetical protein
MPRIRVLTLFTLLAITVTIVTACGGTQAPQSSASTAALAATAVSAPTTAPAPTAASLADTNPAKPDDTTQGRLRISNCIYAGDGVDMLINGKLTANGGVRQANLGALDVSGYQYLTPGTYSVAIVPTGQGIDNALLGPLDVRIVAGHRYTLVMLGQLGEKTQIIRQERIISIAGAGPSLERLIPTPHPTRAS